MIRVLLIASFTALPLLVVAGKAQDDAWAVSHVVDSMTDASWSKAYATSPDGSTLAVYIGGKSKEQWIEFRLAGDNFALLDDEKLIMVRVDKYEPIDVIDMRSFEKILQIVAVAAEPKWVHFDARLADAAFPDGVPRLIRRLQGGSRVLVRYYLATGGFQETTFSLVGARKAIASALGVSETWNTQAAEEYDRLDAAREAAESELAQSLHRCSNDSSASTLACTTREGDCMRALVTADRSVTMVESSLRGWVSTIPGKALSLGEYGRLAACFHALER